MPFASQHDGLPFAEARRMCVPGSQRQHVARATWSEREPPRSNLCRYAQHLQFGIQEHGIDREAQTKRVNRAAGGEQDSLMLAKCLSPE